MPYDVLIVDDSDVTRSMIVKTLSLTRLDIGRCYEASNGREALEILEDHWVDVMLADLNMPIMDGEALLRIMRASHHLAGVPVVIVTSERLSPGWLEDRWSGAAYLRKPFTPEELRDVVEALAGSADPQYEPDLVLKPFCQALETLTFMFADIVPPGEESPASGDFFRAQMAFTGTAAGAVSLVVPQVLGAHMAANALAIEPDDAVALNHAADVVGELLNITCGHVVDALAGDDVELAPPTIALYKAERWPDLTRDPLTIWCRIEGHPVALGLGTR